MRTPDSVDRLQIDAGAVERLAEHARRVLPQESCGVLVGTSSPRCGSRSTSVVAVVPTENVSTGDRRREFAISPRRVLLEYDRAARSGLDVVGFYHSHPSSPAIPSREDLEAAWPDSSYLILGLDPRSAVSLRSWRLAAAADRFDEELIEIVGVKRAVR